jgi:hypothetical protein
MKNWFYIIIILAFTFLGRCYWGWIAFSFSFRFFRWDVDSDSMTGIVFILSDLALLFYLLYMGYRREKKGVKFSTLHKILLTIALTLFVEITINGTLLIYLGRGTGFVFLSAFGFSYPFTLGLTILLTFVLVLNDDFYERSENENDVSNRQ